METAWLIWLAGAGVLAIATPFLALRFGGLRPYVYGLFVFSLQLAAGLNLVYRGYFKPAGVQGIAVSPTLLLGVALVVISMVSSGKRPARQSLLRGSWMWACVAFVATSALSAVNTTVKMYTLFGLVEILSLAVIGTIACHMNSTREGLRITRAVLIASLLAQSGVLLMQNLTGVDFTLSGTSIEAARAYSIGTDRTWMGGRFTGTMIRPSESATFLVVCLIVALGALLSKVEQAGKLRAWSGVALGSICLVLSMTRSAWAGVIIGAVTLVARARRAFRIKVALLASVSVVFCFGLALAWPMVTKRVEAAGEDWVVRWNLNLIAWEMIKANPIAGVGLNNATQVVREYAERAPLVLNEWGVAWIYIPHNQFLLVAAETGIPGLVAFVVLIGSSLRAARVAARSPDPFLSETGTMLTAILLALIWALNLDFVAGAQTYMLLWFVMGFAHGARRCTEAEGALATAPAAIAPPAARATRTLNPLPATSAVGYRPPAWQARASRP